jgi:hypothetical protein
MKKLNVALLLSLLLSCGCARQYVMKLSNNRQITVVGKPELKGSTYYYKDAAGEQHSIPQMKVREILPSSMAKEEQKAKEFKPVAPRKKHWYWPF